MERRRRRRRCNGEKEEEKEKMMIGIKFNGTAAEDSCMKMKKWQWAE